MMMSKLKRGLSKPTALLLAFMMLIGVTPLSLVGYAAPEEDTTPPQVSAVDPDSGTWTNASIAVTVTASDEEEGSGVTAYALIVLTDTKLEPEDTDWQTENTFTVTETGSYTAFAKDASSNVSAGFAVNFNIDGQAPVVSSVTTPPTDWTTSDVTLTVTATDDGGSAVAKYALVELSDTKTEPEDGDWQDDGEFTVTKNGTYTAFAMDGAGNRSEGSAPVTVGCIDKDAPTIVSAPIEPLAWTPAATVTVNANDNNGSGIAKYALINTASKTVPEDSDWQDGNTFTITQSGNYAAFVKDALGNTSAAFAFSANAVDSDKPTISNITPNETNWTNGNITLTIEAADEGGSGIAKYALFEENETKLEPEDGDWVETASFEVTANGTYLGFVKDNAGNVSESKSVTVSNIDKTAPSKPETSGIPESWTNTAASVTVTATDEGGSEIAGYAFVVLNEAQTEPEEDDWQTESAFSVTEHGLYTPFVKDAAGNVTAGDAVEIKVDLIAPEITEVSDPPAEWTKDDVTMTITATDDGDSQIAGYAFVVLSETKTEPEEDEWQTENEFTFTEYGLYTPFVKDTAGSVTAGEAVEILIDKDAPIIVAFSFERDKEPVESEAIEVLLSWFGYYANTTMKVTIRANDTYKDDAEKDIPSSGVGTITVILKDNDGELYTVNDSLEIVSLTNEAFAHEVDENNAFSFEISSSFKGQVFAFAADKIGNAPLTVPGNDYIHSDMISDEVAYYAGESDEDPLRGYYYPSGAIMETEDDHKSVDEPHVSLSIPETTYTQNDGTPLYNGPIDVDVVISDSYAGIREITWSVYEGSVDENKEPLKSGTITVDNNTSKLSGDTEGWEIAEDESENPFLDKNLVTKINGVISVDYNLNDITVVVTMTDRAGNPADDKVVFGIDTTEPTIEVSYDNNDADSVSYYKNSRTATITITERNFRPENVVTSGTINLTNAVWVDRGEPGTDEFTHTTTFAFNHDGDYAFTIDFKDNAENAAETYTETPFTVDLTDPTVTVSYDNNASQNGKYYKADRTATITVTEHNFDETRVTITGTASNGNFPALSAWTGNGDVHTATIHYSRDARYTFDIDVMDKAGRTSADYVAEEFYIDKTAPVVMITGVRDQSANSGEGNIGFVIKATDDNFNVFTPDVKGTVRTDGKFETIAVTNGRTSNIANGRQYAVENLETDGVYIIKCTVIDLAGNAFTQVLLEDAGGNMTPVMRSGDDVLLTFSVNRNGSVYLLDEYTMNLTKTYYVQNVTQDVVIMEINPDAINDWAVTIGETTLVNEKDYSVKSETGSGGWHTNTYRISQSVFQPESEYNVAVSSVDKADNKGFSDMRNAAVRFVVDRTAPSITIAGMKTNGRYRTDKQTVTLLPSDEGGQLASLVVYTVNQRGEIQETLISLSGEELLEALENGVISFELSEGMDQNVRIVCKDVAGNIIGGSEEGETYKNITVSTNAFLLFWANKPLRWSVIGALIALAVGGIAILVIRKKRKV